jgi:sigma-B regulation protein RsbU (phosphoserine phosphatase)
MIGAIDGLDFVEGKTQLNKNETLVLFTDGVNEAVNTSFEEYGDQRFMDILGTSKPDDCKGLINNIVTNVKEFTGDAPQSDDITILTMKRI